MSVAVRPFSKGKGWEVDIITVLPSGEKVRERRKARVSSKSAALRWGLAREREIIKNGRLQPTQKKETPTVSEFVPRFLEEGTARGLKPSTVAARETALRVHVIPLLGAKRLDEVSNIDVQELLQRLAVKAPKTKNNVLSVLSKLLKVAFDWNVIDELPCTVRMVRVPRPGRPRFHDYRELERLLEASSTVDPRAHLVVLLGADAGLRVGEMIALDWRDIDLAQGRLWVERSTWKKHVTSPKGGHPRSVPLTVRLRDALAELGEHRRRGPVLVRGNGKPVSQRIIRSLVEKTTAAAGVPHMGAHALRRTFCSHLGLNGAPARVIQELAGHSSVTTTQRYMGSSLEIEESAIRLLDRRGSAQSRGEYVESAPRGGENP